MENLCDLSALCGKSYGKPIGLATLMKLQARVCYNFRVSHKPSPLEECTWKLQNGHSKIAICSV